MNFEDYQKQRAELLAQAEEAKNNGDKEAFKAVAEKIKELDAKYEEEVKMQANLNALQKSGISDKLKNILKSGGNTSMDANVYTDIRDSKEYRIAFMNNVLKGTPIPADFSNTDANTKTSDIPAVIPTTIMQRIIEKVEEVGTVFNAVTHTTYPSGVVIPTSNVKPTATWVGEGEGSAKQKKTTGSITFSHFKLRCAISMSLEATVMSLSMFETAFVNQVSEAMIKALDVAIISGAGTASPKGILKETVVDGQNVDITKAGSFTYKTLWEAVKAIPSGYRSKVKWCMNYATFCDIQSMTDSNGQPIARINYGFNTNAPATILGIPVVFTDNVAPYVAAPTADTVVAFLFNFI